MHIWEVTVLVRWTFTNKDDVGEEDSFTIAAKKSSDALKKVEKIALSKSRSFVDSGEDGVSITYSPVSIEDVIKLERGDYIDG